ncbi:hypothetical protein GXP67_19580 [Rhodocytophaga rosea]|uniref:Uncharacterized protein n=1 Tax=Rhodocytophaga rosea TaxID=2704465 RepID=A0A6C0GL61_9BACT|nr:hypothetical protein [Rhodocytophaga rosea]QHT68687.1 hypothetical protein GXP67_19580 [Rhodocytophaga rosea]
MKIFKHDLNEANEKIKILERMMSFQKKLKSKENPKIDSDDLVLIIKIAAGLILFIFILLKFFY